MISLTSNALKNSAQRSTVERILSAALDAVDPHQAVYNHLSRKGDRITANGTTYDLSRYRRVLVVGAGKAGYPMAQAVSNILRGSRHEGIVIVKEGYSPAIEAPETGAAAVIRIIEAGHPIPDERGMLGTKQLIELLTTSDHQDLIICLISGGGSALMLDPVAGVSLGELQKLTELLLSCGADIYEINTLRKHLDRVKGGRLAEFAAPSPLISLILSDVIGDPLEAIASGPTAPDPTTYNEASSILKRYRIIDQVPESITKHIQLGIQGDVADTPKPHNPVFSRIQNIVIGSNILAAEAAARQSVAEGFNTRIQTTHLSGEARHAGPVLADMLRQIVETGDPVSRPACLIWGGETTVTIHGGGMGGRNQELALSAVDKLAGLADVALVTLATDGGDGPTEAAGAIVTGDTLGRAHKLGLYPGEYLAQNNSYRFFKPLGDLVIIGPTMTNVNDLTFAFAFQTESKPH